MKKENMEKTIGGRIKGLLKSQNKRQRDLIKALNTTSSHITRYVKGERIPTIEHLMSLAEFFGVSVDYLIGNSDTVYVQAQDMDLAQVEATNRYTGLSYAAIGVLHSNIAASQQMRSVVNNAVMQQFGEKTSLLLDGTGNLKEFAKALSVSLADAEEFISGKRLTNTKEVVAAANYFGVSVDYLLGRFWKRQISELPQLSDAETLEFIASYTGLSFASVQKLHSQADASRVANQVISSFKGEK